MDRVQELQLRYDGRIPARDLAWARVEDAREAFERRRAEGAGSAGPGGRVGRVRPSPQAIRADMARAMRLIAAREGRCERRHLIAAGFTTSEIALYAEPAARRAAIESERPQGDLLEQMVAAIVEVASRDGSCSEIEIKRSGFTDREIEELGEAACALATLRMVSRGEC